MHDILSSIGGKITGLFIGILASFGFVQAPEPTVGVALPSAVAVFETSLASPITSSASSMTLTANSVRGGSTLSGYNCFTVDEGRTDAEFICGTVSGTAVSSLERGVDPLTGTSTNATLQFAHRRGSVVKITDFPIIQRLRNQANGVETYPNLIVYANTVECGVGSATTTVCPKAYTDQALVSGAPNADTSTKGIVEISTAEEAKRSTAVGSTGAILVLPGSLATTTRNALTASGTIPVTGSDGFTSQSFLNLAQPWTFGSTTATSSATFGSSASPASTTFNGVDYRMPTTRGASSTVLTEDGAGKLTWYFPQVSILYKSTGSSTVSSAATTTVATAVIPANIMGANGTLRFTTIVGGSTGNEKRFEVTYGNGSASTTVFQGSVALGNNREALNGIIANVGTTSDQHTVATMTQGTASVGAQYTVTTKGVQNGGNFDTTQKTYIAFRCSEDTAAACSYKSIIVELLKQ